MSSGKKESSYSVPQFQKPASTGFSLFGDTGKLGADNNYSFNMSPQHQADYTMAEGIRRDLLKSLGLNSGSTTEDPYTKAFMDESLRSTQPRLENSLIGRGLGGSSVYKDAITDLISKAGTQATLNSQSYKTNALGALNSNFFAPQQEIGQNLLNLAQGTDYRNNQQAQEMFQMLLPFTVKKDTPTPNFWQGLGSNFSPLYGDYLRTQGYQEVPGMSVAEIMKQAPYAFMGG